METRTPPRSPESQRSEKCIILNITTTTTSLPSPSVCVSTATRVKKNTSHNRLISYTCCDAAVKISIHRKGGKLKPFFEGGGVNVGGSKGATGDFQLLSAGAPSLI